jgi:hypothetical protein
LVKPLQLVHMVRGLWYWYGMYPIYVLLQKKSCFVELFLQYYHFCDISKFCVSVGCMLLLVH